MTRRTALAEWIGKPYASGPQFVTDELAVHDGRYAWPRPRHTAPIGDMNYHDAHYEIDDLQAERNLA